MDRRRRASRRRRRGWPRGRCTPGPAGRAARAVVRACPAKTPWPENTRVGAVTVLILHPPLAAGGGSAGRCARRGATGAGRAPRGGVPRRRRGRGRPGRGDERRAVRGPVAAARRIDRDTRPRRPGLGGDGAGPRRGLRTPSSRRRRPTRRRPWPTTASRPTRSPSPGPRVLRDLPDLPADNALPRWLDEVAGCPVADLRRRPRLAIDLDSPADVVLAGRRPPGRGAGSPVPARLVAVRSVMADRRAELYGGRPDLGPDAGAHWSGAPPAGSARSWRSAACAPQPLPRAGGRGAAQPRHGRRRRSSGSFSTGTVPRRSGGSWPGSATPRSSTRGCCWPIAWAPTRRHGPSPRIASRPTCCSRTGSAIRGCAS